MVPTPSAPDDHADPAWLVRIRSILQLNEGGVVVGLDGAHLACAGPLVEVLLEDGAEVRVCFEAREMLEAPEDARLVLLHAARDAEFLNAVRPIISERRLRVLVWLEPGDRRELSRRARDFLDWMQESVEVPFFIPAYAEEALVRVRQQGISIGWEGPPLTGLLPVDVPSLTGDVDEQTGVARMREGPVVIRQLHSSREAARFEAMHRTAGRAHGIIWDEPAALPVGTPRVIAEPLDWELASEWLAQAGEDEPRICAALLHLDPIEISKRAGRPLPALPGLRGGAPARADAREVAEPRVAARRRSNGPATRSSSDTSIWWQDLYLACHPVGPPRDLESIVERPAACPGLGSLADLLLARSQPQVHIVAAERGSGLSTELTALGLRLQERRLVVLIDTGRHLLSRILRSGVEPVAEWEFIGLLGLAALRVGRDRWGSRGLKGSRILSRAFEAAFGREIDIDQLVSGTVGARAPDAQPAVPGRMSSWAWAGRGRDRIRSKPMSHAVQMVLQELREATDREIVFLIDDLNRLPRPPIGSEQSESRDEDPRAIEELARVFHERDTAVFLLARSGFPRARIPAFNTPLGFWSHVANEARSGWFPGGLGSILDQAAEIYPGNEALARHRSTTSKGTTRSELDVLPADVVLTAAPRQDGRLSDFGYAASVMRVDDLPVVDVDDPAEHGPGIGFLREVIERRLASVPGDRPTFPEDELERLCWASGGCLQQCIRLVRDVAERAYLEPDRVDQQVAAVIRDHRAQLMASVSREGHQRLEATLHTFMDDLPAEDAVARELYEQGILRLYPAPSGGYRALPHSLLIPELLRT